MINDPETARALQQALTNLEHKRKNLADAPDEELVDRANEYEQARRDATPAFAKVAAEFDGVEAGSQSAQTPPVQAPPAGSAEAEQAATPTEASPGVPLVHPPGVVVTAENLATFGPLIMYRSKVDPAVEVEATPYAFAEGTAVELGGESSKRAATVQPSRIVRGEDGLGVQPNDTFVQHFDRIEEEAAQVAPADPNANDTPPPADAEANEPHDEAGPPSSEVQA